VVHLQVRWGEKTSKCFQQVQQRDSLRDAKDVGRYGEHVAKRFAEGIGASVEGEACDPQPLNPLDVLTPCRYQRILVR
jgi:hypothetical protein